MPRTPRAREPAPPFEAFDDEGRTRRIDDYRGRWLVLFFYPKDETPGCVAEVCTFRDRYERFLERDVAVVGVSRDGVESHKAFKERRRLPFTLLADTDGRLTRDYGAKSILGFPRRITFLIDPQGIVQSVHDSHLDPKSHVDEMLTRVEALATTKRRDD